MDVLLPGKHPWEDVALILGTEVVWCSNYALDCRYCLSQMGFLEAVHTENSGKGFSPYDRIAMKIQGVHFQMEGTWDDVEVVEVVLWSLTAALEGSLVALNGGIAIH